MKLETKVVDGATWVRLDPGLAVVPIDATGTMILRGRNVVYAIANLDGKVEIGRAGSFRRRVIEREKQWE
jgi:hypothetical protein